jgi:hypothetical protein
MESRMKTQRNSCIRSIGFATKFQVPELQNMAMRRDFNLKGAVKEDKEYGIYMCMVHELYEHTSE